MGYLGLRLWDLEHKNMLCLGNYVLRITGTRSYVSGHGPRKYSGGPNFFKKEYLSKIFVAIKRKTLVIMSQKYLYKL